MTNEVARAWPDEDGVSATVILSELKSALWAGLHDAQLLTSVNTSSVTCTGVGSSNPYSFNVVCRVSMRFPPGVALTQMHEGLNHSCPTVYRHSQAVIATMAKRYTLSELHGQEYSLSLRVRQKQDEYERRKAQLIEAKEELEDFRDEILAMKAELREMRSLIQSMEDRR